MLVLFSFSKWKITRLTLLSRIVKCRGKQKVGSKVSITVPVILVRLQATEEPILRPVGQGMVIGKKHRPTEMVDIGQWLNKRLATQMSQAPIAKDSGASERGVDKFCALLRKCGLLTESQ